MQETDESNSSRDDRKQQYCHALTRYKPVLYRTRTGREQRTHVRRRVLKKKKTLLALF